MADRTIVVEVAYATAERQTLLRVEVPDGTSARRAVTLSGIEARHPELRDQRPELGIFGRVVSGEHPLSAGDRVEIYRPLSADPKEVRRKLAAEGRSMGRRRPTGPT